MEATSCGTFASVHYIILVFEKQRERRMDEDFKGWIVHVLGDLKALNWFARI